MDYVQYSLTNQIVVGGPGFLTPPSALKYPRKKIKKCFVPLITSHPWWYMRQSMHFKLQEKKKWFTVLSQFANPPMSLTALKNLQHHEVCLSQLCLVIFLSLHLCASGAQLRMEWAAPKDCEKDDLCGKPSTARSRKYQIYHGKSSSC